MMRSRVVFVSSLLSVLLSADLLAQDRGRFRRRGRRPRAAAPAEEKPAPEPAKKVEHWLAITGGDVYLGTGQLLRRATVLVGDDKIKSVGYDIEIPEGAQVIDGAGKMVTPGYVAVKASGMGAPRSETADVADSVNPFDPTIKMGLAAGITSFLASFGSGTAKPGGKTAVIKLAYGDAKGMVVASNTVYSMRVPLGAAEWHDLRKAVDKARKALAAAATPSETKKPEPASKTPPRGGRPAGKKKGDDESLKRVLEGKAQLWISGRRGQLGTEEIRQALEIATLVGHGVVLDSPTTAWVVPDEIAATDSMVILNPRSAVEPDPGRPGTTGDNPAAARLLAQAGVPIAVTPPPGRFGGARLGTMGILGQDLNTIHLDAAFAVRGGLDNRRALRTITLDAARIVGAGERIGSIEPGKDADLLILDGDPLHYRTFVEKAIVNGKLVYQKDKEPFYSHIKR